MKAIEFEQISKLFGDVPAITDLELRIEDREFLAFVGPSGCGKMSLHMLAGLERPSYGSSWIGDAGVSLLSPGSMT